MLNEPSGFRSQPSNAGTTSWPLAKRVCARRGLAAKNTIASPSSEVLRLWTLVLSDLSCSHLCRRTGLSKGLRTKAKRRLLLLILARAICLEAIAFGGLRFELVVAHVVVGEPVSRHVIGGAVAESDPVPRIRIVPIPRGVIVPADDVHDGAGRQQRGDVVGVVVDDLPLEVVVHAIELLD